MWHDGQRPKREPTKIKPLNGKITIQCTYTRRLLWLDAGNLLLLVERFDMFMVSTCMLCWLSIGYLLIERASVCDVSSCGPLRIVRFSSSMEPVFFARLCVNSAHSTIRLSPTRFYATPREKHRSIMEYTEPQMRREPRAMQLNAPLWWRWRWWWWWRRR